MKLINHLGILACTAMVCLTTACGSDDDNNNNQPRQTISFITPNTNGNIVKSIEYNGNFREAYDWNFSYYNGNLSYASGNYRDSSEYEFPYSAQIIYQSNTININTTTSKPNATSSDRDRISTSDIVIGNDGFIHSMKIGQYQYKFEYNFNGCLNKWEVIKSGTGLPGTNEIRKSYANLNYNSNGSLAEIIYTDNDAAPQNKCTVTFTYDNTKPNINGILPEGALKELGFFGFEYLYYAGALGKSPLAYLLKSSHFDYSYEEGGNTDFTINYTYAFSKNNDVKTCYINYNPKYADVKYTY
jgi:hypothetical protein